MYKLCKIIKIHWSLCHKGTIFSQFSQRQMDRHTEAKPHPFDGPTSLSKHTKLDLCTIVLSRSGPI